MLKKLLSDLIRNYDKPFHDLILHRDMIGYVCVVSSKKEQYILKLFKNRNAKQAIQSIEIMTYLDKASFPTAHIVATAAGEAYFNYEIQGENRIGVLYEYIKGQEPNKNTDIIAIGRQTGKLHKLMEDYPHPLSCHEKSFYIDRYIQCLKEMKYPKADEFQAYGDLLWSRVEKLPRGFCHGDYHTGNMLLNDLTEYATFDFDAAARAFPMYDIAVFCDMTNYFNLSECEYEDTQYMLKEFVKGYREYNSISDQELLAIDSFIAIRHFEVQATIIENLGLACIDQEFIDDQLAWLMRWEKLHVTS